MAWRLQMKRRKAPAGMEDIIGKLEEFDERMREAVNSPVDDKMRSEMLWPVHKVHYQKNRFLFEAHYREGRISKKLLDYLVREGIADGKLIAKWRKPGYERLCSLQAITKSNTNFGTTSVCRVPLKDRHGQILPNVMTGCVSCASGDGGPIWWDDPVPEIAIRRAQEADPGKARIRQTTAEEFEEARREGRKAVEEAKNSMEETWKEPGDGRMAEHKQGTVDRSFGKSDVTVKASQPAKSGSLEPTSRMEDLAMDKSDKQNVQEGGVQTVSPVGTNEAMLALEEGKAVARDNGGAAGVSGMLRGEEADGRVHNAPPSSPQDESENRHIASDPSGGVLRPEETEKAEMQSK